MQKKSLVELAQRAGFYNLHNIPGRCAHILGSLMSEHFEMFYFRWRKEDLPKKLPVDTMGISQSLAAEVVGIKDPYNHKACAMYRFQKSELEKWAGIGGIDIDEEKPLYQGTEVVEILRAYAKNSQTR